MVKNILIILISFAFIFSNNSKVFALNITVNQYNFEKTIIEFEKPYQRVESISSNEDNPIWLTNLIYPGIAQVIMGNTVSGLAFIISYSILLISETSFIVLVGQTLFSNSFQPQNLYLLGGNTILLFLMQIWSLFDAYTLSKANQPKNNSRKLSDNFINQAFSVNSNLLNEKISVPKLTLNVFSHSF